MISLPSTVANAAPSNVQTMAISTPVAARVPSMDS
jgi:hypothetical protein